MDSEKKEEFIIFKRQAQFNERNKETTAWISWVLQESTIGSDDEFENKLRDGVLFCKLFNTIYPEHAVNITPPSPSDPFVNVYTFIAALRKISFNEQWIFSPSDLYAKRNWVRVIYCIRMFAHFVRTDREDFEKQIKPVSTASISVPEFKKTMPPAQLEYVDYCEEILNNSVVSVRIQIKDWFLNRILDLKFLMEKNVKERVSFLPINSSVLITVLKFFLALFGLLMWLWLFTRNYYPA